MRINKERMIKEFVALVSIDSPSFGEKQMGEHIKQHLVSLDFSVSQDDTARQQNGSHGNIYGFLKGDITGEPLLFCSHMDTVEPSSGKQAIIGENGIITSSGKTVLGADDCSGISAILEALYTIKELKLSHRSIEVLFTIAEEVYAKGVKHFDFSKIRAKEAYVLDLAGPVGFAAYKAPTILSFTVTINGKSAHAGFEPQNGIHAIAVAANAISQLRMGQVDDDTTLNIGVIKGGQATNIVPDHCVINGEIRSFSHAKALEQANSVKKHFEAIANAVGATVDYQVLIGCEAYETQLEHPVVKRFERACEKQGLTVSVKQTFGGSDNNYLAKRAITGIVVASAMNRCHSCEEYTNVEELHRIAELTVSLMTAEN